MVACERGHLSTDEILINHDNGLLQTLDHRGWTPLLTAVHRRKLELIPFLIDRGASVNEAAADGMTPLILACQLDYADAIQLVLDAGPDVDAREEQRRTALFFTAAHGSIGLMHTLIDEHKANLLFMDKQGETVLDWVKSRGNSIKQTILVEAYGSNMTREKGGLACHSILSAADYLFPEDAYFHPPMKPNLQIRSPLGKLSLRNLRFLLLHALDTDLIHSRDESGKLPIHIACKTNTPAEVLAFLVDLDPATLHIADHSGALPLHDCCSGGAVDDISVRYLVEQGGAGTLAARNHQGALPLHTLCGSTHPSLRTVQHLVQSFPAAVKAQTKNGEYPFMIAACESSTASLSVIFELVRASPGLLQEITQF